jgi:hypothetical protein
MQALRYEGTIQELSYQMHVLLSAPYVKLRAIPECLRPGLYPTLIGETLSTDADGDTVVPAHDVRTFWHRAYYQNAMPAIQFHTPLEEEIAEFVREFSPGPLPKLRKTFLHLKAVLEHRRY